MDQSIIFDPDLIAKYDQSGPRYTSYPTAVEFHTRFNIEDYQAACGRGNAAARPLSLYLHIPFCDTVCFYCACNKIATKNRKLTGPYLQRVYQELALQATLIDATRPVKQLHWGGGTPTFISYDEMQSLMDTIGKCFKLMTDDTGEYSIEIDPREANTKIIRLLRNIGFNRMSLGVQDFNTQVQQAVNRIQSEAKTLEVIDAARDVGFRSISFDLIYGLPLQTAKSFAITIERVIQLAPDRLSLFNYAHLPQMFPPQRRIDPEQLPTPAMKLGILSTAIDQLTAAGYVFIGMDHFARPDDELAIAQRQGTLHRNFQGYSTHADCDLVGLGVTAISIMDSTYSQNIKTLDPYYEALDAGHLPLLRGISLTKDDEIRRNVITQLICHFELKFATIE
ncbi:coproporphyrinogen III oxidase, partial [Achromatium sp. WMS1]